MFETDEEAQKMKQTFERLFKEQGESIEDMQTALATKTAEVAELSSRLEESESRLKLAREELDAKQRAEIENSKQIRLLREQIRGLEERLSTKQSDFASITQAYELLKSDKKLTEVRINNLEENLADVTTHLGHEKDKSQHLKDLYVLCSSISQSYVTHSLFSAGTRKAKQITTKPREIWKPLHFKSSIWNVRSQRAHRVRIVPELRQAD